MSSVETHAEDVALVREALEALRTGGISAAAEYFDDDVELRTAGLITRPLACHGRAEVIAWVRQLDETFEGIQWEPLEFIDCPTAVAVCSRVSGRAGRAQMILTAGFWVRGGKIVRIQGWRTREHALRELDPNRGGVLPSTA